MFLFEFDVLCHNYDYQSDAQKLKLFPVTLKDATLCWFMNLRNIKTQNNMKEVFLTKYQEYCKTKEVWDEILHMTQKKDQSMEDYLEHFMFNFQRSRQPGLTPHTIKMLFLRGMRDDTMDALNLIGKDNVSKLIFDDICDICKNYSIEQDN